MTDRREEKRREVASYSSSSCPVSICESFKQIKRFRLCNELILLDNFHVEFFSLKVPFKKLWYCSGSLGLGRGLEARTPALPDDFFLFARSDVKIRQNPTNAFRQFFTHRDLFVCLSADSALSQECKRKNIFLP
jgi:hypothetical protein